MRQGIKCFLSYAHVDRDFVYHEVVPILRELGLDVWLDSEQITFGLSVQDEILKGIRDADLIVAVLNGRSIYVNFEVGAALGQAKPTLAIIRDKAVSSDLLGLSHFDWIDSNNEGFRLRFRRAIEIITHHPIDETVYSAAENTRVIGIEIGHGSTDIEEQLRITADLIALLKKIARQEHFELIQARKGSFSSFFNLDLRAWAELIEKVIFIIPEWKKRNLENLRIEAEIERTRLESDQIQSAMSTSERKAQIEHADAMLDIFERSRKLGIKVQLGEELLLSNDEDALIKVERPKRLEKR